MQIDGLKGFDGEGRVWDGFDGFMGLVEERVWEREGKSLQRFEFDAMIRVRGDGKSSMDLSFHSFL